MNKKPGVRGGVAAQANIGMPAGPQAIDYSGPQHEFM
jgi:hypothetical protein